MHVLPHLLCDSTVWLELTECSYSISIMPILLFWLACYMNYIPHAQCCITDVYTVIPQCIDYRTLYMIIYTHVTVINIIIMTIYERIL